MGNQIKLSVVIITLNEEKNIQRCLQSIQNLADEIIVLDSFSTDQTENICKSFNVNFIKNEFKGYIHQKNTALYYATNDFVLSLDADEAVSPELASSIKKIKENCLFDGYILNRLTNYCGKWIRHSGWYPDQKLRLFNKKKGKWGGFDPHDTFILDAGSTSSLLKGDLYHYSFYSIEQHLQTINKFTSLAAQARFNEGIKSNWIKININPGWKFIRNYFFKLGFLDGFYGFTICKLSAYATFIRYVKLKELWKTT